MQTNEKMIHNLAEQNSILSYFVSELRDVEIQKDPLRFRRNLERVAEVLGYELSKSLNYKKQSVQTPLGISDTQLLSKQPVLATILRAGLGMHLGLLNYFDRAESSFISAYRKHTNAEEFDVHIEYLASPKIDDKVLIISDPMLATGMSMYLVYKAMLKQGNPTKVIVVSAIASKDALDFLKVKMPQTTEFYVAAIDSELTAQSYIVPGLGDAGDLAYGEKC